mmetsp:Transcript_7387/g.12311  ORF Transcript_7387/g.12311 Transcript_7387/m.12311 type:complete len:337 (-) Transcript_7387:759-1769(-)
MKPICMLGMLVVSLSIIGLAGIPKLFSSSPCAKNSWMTRSAQALEMAGGLTGPEMSALCRSISTRKSLCSEVSRRHSGAGTSPAWKARNSPPCFSWRALIWLIWAKWDFMSVPRIAWTISLRTEVKVSLSNFTSTFVSGSFKISKRTELCMFSSGETSLYVTANLFWVFTRKALFRPGWPASWARAASSRQACSAGDTKARDRAARASWNVAKHTSTPCLQLWYGLGRYLLLSAANTGSNAFCVTCRAAPAPAAANRWCSTSSRRASLAERASKSQVSSIARKPWSVSPWSSLLRWDSARSQVVAAAAASVFSECARSFFRRSRATTPAVVNWEAT